MRSTGFVLLSLTFSLIVPSMVSAQIMFDPKTRIYYDPRTGFGCIYHPKDPRCAWNQPNYDARVKDAQERARREQAGMPPYDANDCEAMARRLVELDALEAQNQQGADDPCQQSRQICRDGTSLAMCSYWSTLCTGLHGNLRDFANERLQIQMQRSRLGCAG